MHVCTYIWDRFVDVSKDVYMCTHRYVVCIRVYGVSSYSFRVLCSRNLETLAKYEAPTFALLIGAVLVAFQLHERITLPSLTSGGALITREP